MSEEPQLREYGQGEYVVLRVELQDKTGISTVQASAILQEDRRPLTDFKANLQTSKPKQSWPARTSGWSYTPKRGENVTLP